MMSVMISLENVAVFSSPRAEPPELPPISRHNSIIVTDTNLKSSIRLFEANMRLAYHKALAEAIIQFQIRFSLVGFNSSESSFSFSHTDTYIAGYDLYSLYKRLEVEVDEALSSKRINTRRTESMAHLLKFLLLMEADS